MLKVISKSPGELEPVFNAMLENATRICEATFGHLWLFERNAFRAVAVHSKQSFVDQLRRNPVETCTTIRESRSTASPTQNKLSTFPTSG